jgi:hypothetical protein
MCANPQGMGSSGLPSMQRPSYAPGYPQKSSASYAYAPNGAGQNTGWNGKAMGAYPAQDVPAQFSGGMPQASNALPNFNPSSGMQGGGFMGGRDFKNSGQARPEDFVGGQLPPGYAPYSGPQGDPKGMPQTGGRSFDRFDPRMFQSAFDPRMFQGQPMQQPQGQQPQGPAQQQMNPMNLPVMNINDYGNAWQNAGGADLTGQSTMAQQQAQAQAQAKGIVLAEGPSQNMAGANPNTYFQPAQTPTYLQGPTAGLFGGASGPPPDPRMVWGMGNMGGKTGWNLVPGWNGVK